MSRSSTPSQVRELAFGAAHARETRDAAAERDVAVEDVADVAAADHLRGIALRRVRRPDIEVVAELRREEPAVEGQEELLQLEVLTPRHRLHVAESVGVRVVQPELIQIPHVGEEPRVHLAFVAVEEQEPAVRDVAGRLLLRFFLHRGARGAHKEVSDAPVGDPDALVVIAPGLSEEARGLAVRADEHHAAGGVGLAVLPRVRRRRAGNRDRCRRNGRRWCGLRRLRLREGACGRCGEDHRGTKQADAIRKASRNAFSSIDAVGGACRTLWATCWG